MEELLVWTEIQSQQYWPGKICSPKPDSNPRNTAKLIFFFGTKDYGWAEESKLKPYVEYRDSIVKTIRNKNLRDAVKRTDEYLLDPKKYRANAINRNKESHEGHTSEAPLTVNPAKKRHQDYKSIIENIADALRPRPNPAESSIDRSANEPPQIVAQKKLERIVASKKKIGFIGVGTTGSGIEKNLLNYGHKVIIWNHDPSQSKKLEDIQVGLTPCEVAQKADVIFCCVSDPEESTEIFFGSGGILSSTQHLGGKDYVEMTGLDVTTSQRIAQAIESEGGRYLEAPILESRVQAEEDGTLIILAAGERTLFDECQSCFNAIAKTSIYLGDVGYASNMRLVIQMAIANSIAGLAEPLSLAGRTQLPLTDVMEIMGLTTLSSPFIMEKGKAMTEQNFAAHQPLTHMQKDIRLGLQLSEQNGHAMPVTAATNEVFKEAKRNGDSLLDISAVYKTRSTRSVKRKRL